jgi:hypothetical protein
MSIDKSTSYVVLTNVNKKTEKHILTDQEKIKMYDECRNKTYHNEKLEPVIEDLYNMFEFDFKHHLGFNFDVDDNRKIKHITNLLQPLYDVIDTNNIPLFHKLVFEVTHPNNNTISTHLIFDMMNLLLFPQEYLSQEDHYFSMITDYFISENKYDFYSKNSTYPYFDYLNKLYNHGKEHNIKYTGTGIEVAIIYYFLKNNTNPNNFIDALDYVHNNIQFINSFYRHNYKKENEDEFLNVLMNVILNELDHRVIK